MLKLILIISSSLAVCSFAQRFPWVRPGPKSPFCCPSKEKCQMSMTCTNGTEPIRQIFFNEITRIVCERCNICPEDCDGDVLESRFETTCANSGTKRGPKNGMCCPFFFQESEKFCPPKVCEDGDPLVRRMVEDPENPGLFCPRCAVCASECPGDAEVFEGVDGPVCA